MILVLHFFKLTEYRSSDSNSLRPANDVFPIAIEISYDKQYGHVGSQKASWYGSQMHWKQFIVAKSASENIPYPDMNLIYVVCGLGVFFTLNKNGYSV